MIRKITYISLCAIFLGGCATTYHSEGATGGYSETLLTPDTFVVDFSGNAYTSAERSSDFAILRAADKSESLGCDHFIILNGGETSSVGSVSVSSTSWGQNSAISTGGIFPIVKPNSKLIVKCFKGNPPSNIQAFDVSFIQNSIRTKYKMKPYSIK